MSHPARTLEHSEGNDVRLLGAQAAARYLGLHRSTVFLAVRQGVLRPDARTHGGHTRFRLATLDAYKAQFAVASATGETAQTPFLRAVGEIARALADATSPCDAAETAAALVQGALPGVDGVTIAEMGNVPGDPLAIHLLTQPVVPDYVLRNFERLRHTFRFGTTTALRTLEAEICEDTSSEQAYTGTRSIVRIWNFGAYAIYPIVAHGESLGLLFCTSARSRRYTVADRAFLQAVVGLLALAFERFQQMETLRALGAMLLNSPAPAAAASDD